MLVLRLVLMLLLMFFYSGKQLLSSLPMIEHVCVKPFTHIVFTQQTTLPLCVGLNSQRPTSENGDQKQISTSCATTVIQTKTCLVSADMYCVYLIDKCFMTSNVKYFYFPKLSLLLYFNTKYIRFFVFHKKR